MNFIYYILRPANKKLSCKDKDLVKIDDVKIMLFFDILIND